MDYILKLIDLCPILSKADDIIIYVSDKDGLQKGTYKVDNLPYWMLMRWVRLITYMRVEQTSNFALCIYLETEEA